MGKQFIYIEYKYPDQHWQEYDRTQVEKWADVQFSRMLADHPGAEHRKVKR